MSPRVRSFARLGAIIALVTAAAPSNAGGQTVRGTLLDVDTDRPIPLGLVMMFTAQGDSITAVVTDTAGRFSVSSDEPGEFVLVAAALGYEETPAGVFELGPGGILDVEYRLPSAPLPIDAIIVSVGRPVLEHNLVRRGFVRRLQRGLGRFITPYDIERSPARSTEALLEGVPQLRVGTVTGVTGGIGLPQPHLGEAVQIVGPTGGWCTPRVVVDGLPVHYAPGEGFTLSQYARIDDVEAIEVYRRPAEIPVEFGQGTQAFMTATDYFSGSGPQTGCGLIVVWTKMGLAPGQRPAAGSDLAPGARTLPRVRAEGPAPVQGETIRVELVPELARSQAVVSPWQGTVQSIDRVRLVGIDANTGYPVVFPLEGIRELQVQRTKGSADAWLRGAIGGTVFGAGTWGFLSLLCAITCGPDADEDTVTPGVVAGVVVGGLLVIRGPGTRWVRTPVAELRGGPEPGSLELSFRLPGLDR